jgi:hypothetical protein
MDGNLAMNSFFENMSEKDTMDAIDRMYQRLYKKNRSPIWDNVVITHDEIDARMHRVGQDGVCMCGKPNGEHPFSEAVLELTGNYLYELCNGWLAKF